MSWLLITILAYFLNAIAMIVDKTILKKDVKDPLVYIFYIAILGTLVMLLIVPFGFEIPDLLIIFISLAAGAVWVWALFLMFKALKEDDASRIGPMIGGLTPIFIFVLAWYTLGETLNCNQYIAFIFLIIGALLISFDFEKHGAYSWLRKKFSKKTTLALPQIRKTLWLALPAAVLFGISHVMTKFVYMQIDFLSGFIWTRLGMFLVILFLFLIPKNRKLLFKNLKKQKKSKTIKVKHGGGMKVRFLFGQACGGASALLIQYAIFLGSVTLVAALQGLQYAFVFVLALILTLLLPKLIKEKLSKEIVLQKIIAIFLIGVGLYFIAF